MGKDELKNLVAFEKIQEDKVDYRFSNVKNYLAYATNSRCEGYCQLWIIDTVQNHLEYFDLKFNREGIVNYSSIYGKKKINDIFASEKHHKITYMEALQLLGDAARQNYKYGYNLQIVEAITSLHLERSWQKDWQLKHKSYILGGKNISMFDIVSLYTQSVMQGDGALYYSLFVSDKQKENRDLYLHTWSHPLEGFVFQQVEIEVLHYDVLAKKMQIWLLAEAKRPDDLKLELDLCLLCIHTVDGYRILEESIKEVRRKRC